VDLEIGCGSLAIQAVIIVGFCFVKFLDTTVERIFLPIFSIDPRHKDLTPDSSKPLNIQKI
jgi:hypothetical protein